MPCSRRANRRLRSIVSAIGSAAVTTAERFSVFQEEHPDAAFCALLPPPCFLLRPGC